MKKVAIFFGGASSEYEVSLLSAKNVISSIDTTLFEVVEVHITKDGVYHINSGSYTEEEGLKKLVTEKIDVIFPIIHGAYGEDGTLQEKLERLGIPFVGSSSKASRITIQKDVANKIFASHGILVPQEKSITRSLCDHGLKYSIIVKPKDEGSSVGLFKFENDIQYKASIDSIFRHHTTMLAQEYISGREFTCGVFFDGKELIALPPTEVLLTKTSMFDYEAKYTKGMCSEITPANVDNDLYSLIQETAKQCHMITGCGSLSRTDMILSDKGLYVLEINTVPGMTETSFIPAQVTASGNTFTEFLTKLINASLP